MRSSVTSDLDINMKLGHRGHARKLLESFTFVQNVLQSLQLVQSLVRKDKQNMFSQPLNISYTFIFKSFTADFFFFWVYTFGKKVMSTHWICKGNLLSHYSWTPHLVLLNIIHHVKRCQYQGCEK